MVDCLAHYEQFDSEEAAPTRAWTSQRYRDHVYHSFGYAFRNDGMLVRGVNNACCRRERLPSHEDV